MPFKNPIQFGFKILHPVICFRSFAFYAKFCSARFFLTKKADFSYCCPKFVSLRTNCFAPQKKSKRCSPCFCPLRAKVRRFLLFFPKKNEGIPLVLRNKMNSFGSKVGEKSENFVNCGFQSKRKTVTSVRKANTAALPSEVKANGPSTW
uniref:Uncharacterized protein n=1 Tax=Tupiella akineta TaxID=160070 RepID=Q3ZJ36_TUPAK|nr:hypothetical protein PsakCp057 [Tupiella akineta]AAV80653.1 hypothetical protein [Tupiella akineta]